MAEHFAPAVAWQQGRRRGAYRLAGLIGAVVVVGALLQGGTPLLSRAGVVAVPQHFVALYFAKPKSLPARARPGGEISFEFRVANATAGTIGQPWTVSATLAGSTVVLDRGTVRIRPASTAAVAVSAPLPKYLRAGTGEVTVALPGRDLAPLEFHVRVVGSAAS
jgi:hypothetical protein